jgi:hypothetical protein
MDPAAPPDLERFFDAYDAIRSAEPDEAQPPARASSFGSASSLSSASSLRPSLSSDHDEPPWQRPSWQEQMARRALEEHENRDETPTATFKQDEDGLAKAYADASGPGVYYDPTTKTEYIAGSKTRRDWYDDFTKVPFWGDLRQAERYQQAESELNALENAGKPVRRLVGHSLGGSVSLELARRHPKIRSTRTFGAPVLDFSGGDAERYRHPLDPVSILDRRAHWGPLRAYPHTYTGFG